MRLPRRPVWLAVLGMAAVAHAANAPVDALAQARAAIASASFEKALSLADRALKTVDDNTLRGDLELVRAECFHALRKKAQMAVALDRALRANPLAALDADLANPELINELERRRKALSGMLAVTSPHERALPRIALDGRPLGTAPLTTASSIGRHRVKVTWPGGEVEEHEVLIRADVEVSLALTAPAPPPPPASTPVAASAAPEPAPAPSPQPEPIAPVSPVEATSSPSFLRWQWLSIGAGVVGAVVGTICLASAAARYNALVSGAGLTFDLDGAKAYAAGGRALQAAGIALTVAGVVAAGAGVLGLTLELGRAQVAVGVAPGGAVVGLAGVLP